MANYSKNQQDKSFRELYCKPNKRRLRLKDVMRQKKDQRGQIERQRRGLIKTTHSRARQLEIAASLYGLSKDLRATYYSEKNPRSRIRGVGSGSQVIRRGTILSFHSYYLWEFGSFLCFFSFVILLLCDPNKILQGIERTKRLFSPLSLPLLLQS